MTTTANHRTAAGNNMSPEPEEDIAAIAKQISDHAEAIYQTWKARGLAPNEILTCHRDSSAADKFGSALTPQSKPATTTVTDTAHKLLADPNTNNLERLVNKFVVEDKARLQAARQSRSLSPKPFASSIQYALQKFEQKASCSGPEPVQQPQPKPNNVVVGVGPVKRYSKSPIKSYPSDDYTVSSSAAPVQQSNGPSPPSWHFRNSGGKSGSPESQNANFMDEVAKEEQRLIDALKNGSVIENCRKSEKPAVPSKEGVLLRSAGYISANNDAGIVGRSKPEFLIGLSALSSSRRNQQAQHRREQEQVPHPELTDHQRANIRSNHHLHQSNPVRPFLTRGSVAERVLIFEKCPTELMKNSNANATNNSAQSSWRNIGSDVHGKIQVRHTNIIW